MGLLQLIPLILALGAVANPIVVRSSPVKLPLARVVQNVGSYNILQRDQARARLLQNTAHSTQAGGVFNLPVDNQAVIYIASIGVGTPPSFYNLIVDTGSSNTWVGANKSYVRTSSSQRTVDAVSVTYGSGSMTGREFIDSVTLAPGLVVQHQGIGVSTPTTAQGFAPYDGILGIGPTDLTQGTLFPDFSSTIPTVVDNAWSQSLISAYEVGVSFQPTTSTDALNGELTWGGVDTTKFNGTLNFVPLTTTSPASAYWGINQFITYGTSTILPTTAGIVDTGTTLILIASDAYTAYTSATGATPDATTGLLTISAANYANLKSLFFNINGIPYELTANAQTWPRSLNTAIGGNANSIYLVVGNLGTASGQGLDFINGYTFLERYYSVYDTANKRVGFAQTPFTFATTN